MAWKARLSLHMREIRFLLNPNVPCGEGCRYISSASPDLLTYSWHAYNSFWFVAEKLFVDCTPSTSTFRYMLCTVSFATWFISNYWQRFYQQAPYFPQDSQSISSDACEGDPRPELRAQDRCFLCRWCTQGTESFKYDRRSDWRYFL